MAYFVEDLLESIKSRSLAPISQSTFTDAKLVSMADEELQLKMVSDLISVREDFFLTEESTSIIAEVENYPVPSRAIGNALKQVFFIPTGTTTKIPLVRVDSERVEYFQTDGSEPRKYYILGDEIILLPTPQTACGSLLFVFPAKPNTLTQTLNCAKITAKISNVTTASFTVNTDLSSSLAVGDYVDFLSASAPFKLWKYRAQITQITSSLIEVAIADVTNAAGTVEPLVNDYIVPTGTSNIPQIPISHHAILSQMVVVRLMESLGDLNKMNAARATLNEMRMEASKLVKNRVENSPVKVNWRKKLGSYFR
jgi:hypothetical protein